MYQSLAQAEQALSRSAVGSDINPVVRDHIVREMFERGLSPSQMYSEFRDYHVWIKPVADTTK